MKLSAIRPILYTAQLRETIDFYTGILGFTCDEYDEDWGWASLHRDSAELMLSKPNAHTKFEHPAFTGSFYINTDNVDLLWNELQHKVNIVYPIETFEWEMREFGIYDNNGYLLQFGQPVNENI